MAQDSKSRKLDQYIVRFPDSLRDYLKATAVENGRSLNAEIIARLESYDRLSHELDDERAKRSYLEKSLNEGDPSGQIARARDIIENLLQALSSESGPEFQAMSEYAALMFLGGMPLTDISMLEFVDRYQQKQKGRVDDRIRQVANNALEPVISFMKKRGWTVIPPERT